MANLLYQLLDFLNDRFNIEEIKDICMQLGGVDYEDLLVQGHGKRSFARELIRYLERRQRLEELLPILEARRPQLFTAATFQLDAITERDSLTFLADETVKAADLQLNDDYYAYYSLAEHEAEIERLGNLLISRNGRSVAMISGLGGIGKTAVTIELLRKILADAGFPFRKITWTSAKKKYFNEGSIKRLGDAVLSQDALQNSIGYQLAETIYDQHQTMEQKKLFLQQFLHDVPTLIVVDNIETLKNASDIILQYQGMLGPSKLLINSREAMKGDYFLTQLPQLSLESSAKFIQDEIDSRKLQLGGSLDHVTLEKIYDVVGGMPLALKLVVSQSARLGLRRTLADLQSGGSDIYTYIFTNSWRSLSPLSQALLRYLGENLNTVSLEELELVAEDCGASDEFDESLDDLVRRSLVNTEPLAGFGELGYNIHQLTRQFVINDLPVN